jgi:phosphoribosylanthranilate isomerase
MTTKTKICGIHTVEAMDAALEGGADYVGLVFFPRSPRHVDVKTAQMLSDRARGQAKIVALFVDPDDRVLDSIIDKIDPDIIQLHGDESPPRVREIKSRVHLPIFKAIKVATAKDAHRADVYKDAADLVIFDAKPKREALPGGNGHAFDWHALDDIKGKIDFMLSGGLTPENVRQAIELTGASAVDVSSGVETSPGLKDPDMIRRFLAAVKNA